MDALRDLTFKAGAMQEGGDRVQVGEIEVDQLHAQYLVRERILWLHDTLGGAFPLERMINTYAP